MGGWEGGWAEGLPETQDSLARGIRRGTAGPWLLLPPELVTAAEIYVWNSREAWVALVHTECCDINPQRYWTCSGRDARLRGLCVCCDLGSYIYIYFFFSGGGISLSKFFLNCYTIVILLLRIIYNTQQSGLNDLSCKATDDTNCQILTNLA